MTQQTITYLKKFANHFSHLFNTQCTIVDVCNKNFILEATDNENDLLKHCTNGNCNLLDLYLYGCNEAQRWGGKYIYYCYEGLVFVAASVTTDAGLLEGGLVLGPIIMGDMEDTLLTHEHKVSYENIPNIQTDKIHDIAEILAASVSSITHSGEVIHTSHKSADILQTLYYNKEEYEDLTEMDYPFEAERQLQMCILNGDKHGAQVLLNELLGKIYFISKFDLNIIKIRTSELLALLSRASIEAGANSGEIIWFSTGSVKEMQNCKSIDEISDWITTTLYRFINYSFDFSSLKHSDTVYKVIEYIRKNYFKKISLDDIANHVNFSKTYLSRIFKDEVGENISNYVNKIRIEKAKLLIIDKKFSLIDIANLVGFEDQSYFTKVFKSIVGISPKKYKESRSK